MSEKGRLLASASGQYYTECFREFGANARGVDWSTEDGQELRFNQLDQIWIGTPQASICDFGCGYGAYLQHLKASGHKGNYVGIDISKEMIECAQRSVHAEPSASFAVAHEPQPSDFIVASGTFNVIPIGTRRDWDAYVWQVIECMRDRARLGFAFNLILPPTSPRLSRETLFWASPTVVSQKLERMNLSVLMSRDYGLHEATYLAARKTHGHSRD